MCTPSRACRTLIVRWMTCLVLLLTTGSLAGPQIESTWILNGSGAWSVDTNWSNGIPNAAGDAARFLSAITAAQTVNQDVDGLILGTIELDNANAYTISGNPITLQVTTGSAAISVNSANGTGAHVISTGLTLTSPLTVTQNSTAPVTFSGVVTGPGGVTKDGPGTLVLSGTSSNAFNVINVNAGRMTLNKTGGATALGVGISTLTIGDGVGGTDADVMALGGAAQFPIGVRIVVNSSGLLDCGNNFNVVTGGMTMTSGRILNPELRLTANTITNAAADPAVITGGNIEFFGSTRSFTVADGAAADDMIIASRISNGGLIKAGPGRLVLDGAEANDHGNTTITAGTLVAAKADALGTGVLTASDGTLRFSPGLPKATKVGGIAIATGVIDMTDNDLVVEYTGTSPLGTVIKPAIVSGYAGGAWNGPGINSTSAAAVTTHGLGYAEASAIFTSFPATFSGQSVDDTAVLIAYVRYGDANLDGSVGLADFNRLAANFGSGDEWSEGDFNYDNQVTLADFNRLAANFGLSASPGGPTPQDWATLAAAIPEPAAAMASVVCGWLLCRSRRHPRS